MAVSSRSFLIHFSLLLLLSSSCAWANDGSRPEGPARGRRWSLGGSLMEEGPRLAAREVAAREFNAEDAMPLWRRVGVEIREVVDHVDKLVERQRLSPRSPVPTRAAEHADKLVRDACLALITPAPSLAARQDQGQINALSNQLQQLSDRSRQVSQASQQVSQASQQLSQSLQQANQQLSQTRDQLATARAQSSAASQAAQQASDAARQASEAAAQASSSASSAIASAIASASQSANDAIAANLASITSSAGANIASLAALASASAASAADNAASMIKQAQADATAVRTEAGIQVQKAQGTAVSVTQAALAIVGAIIGSSLLTVLTFMLVLRYKRIKRRQSRLAASSQRNISYPALSQASNGGYDSNGFGVGPRDLDANGFPLDFKEPPRAAGSMVSGPFGLQRTNTSGSMRSGVPGVGLATSDYGPPPAAATSTKEFTLKEPPKGKFSLFPRPQDDPPAQQSASTSKSGPSPKSPPRGSKIFPPSLDTWLRAGTVSPFGTLQNGKEKEKEKGQEKRETNEWPIMKN